MAFVPKVLLFGSISAVLHYNCFSRCLAVLVNKCLGIPLVNYYDDFGAYCPASILFEASSSFSKFSNSLGALLNDEKTKFGETIKFLGLKGVFPSIGNGMLLRIFLPKSKIEKWSTEVEEILRCGSVEHKPLEKIIGKLSFTQTSIFGRFGRTMLRPLYNKKNAHPYVSTLSEDDKDNLRWWVASIRACIPRVVEFRAPNPEFLVYSDAATSTRIITAVVINVAGFISSGKGAATFSETTSKDWVDVFDSTTYIYGLEMLAIIATLMKCRTILRGRNVVFYIDNTNAKDALVKGFSPTPVINRLIQLFWAIIQVEGIWAWFEWVPSGVNVGDLPTRNAKISFPVDYEGEFGFLSTLKSWTTDYVAKEAFFISNEP